MILPAAKKGNATAKTFDDAVKLERIAFKRPFDEAYGTIGRGRRVKIALDGNCAHCCRFKAADRGAWELICREEFENVNERLCIENALEWVDAQ